MGTMMNQTKYTINIRTTTPDWDREAFEQALDQFMESYPFEFEDWKVRNGARPIQSTSARYL